VTASAAVAQLRDRLGRDHMMRNSLFLMSTAGLQAALGFAFWIATARLFPVGDVGRASSLISATTVISFLALLGLNNAFARYLPTAPDKNALITAGLLLVTVSGAVIALVYVLLIPLIAPRLAFVTRDLPLAAGFVVVTAAAGVNVLTDQVFIAGRRSGFMPVVDGLVGGAGKMTGLILLTGAGAYGLFCASSLGALVPAVVSVLVIYTVLRHRFSLRELRPTLAPVLRFSVANYAGNILNLLPTLVVPLIVLDRLGAAPAAYYFVSFQVATILYAAALSVEHSFLAEGSQADVDMRLLKQRSRRILVMLFVPAALGLAAVGRWLLLAFGPGYERFGTPSLILFALAAAPIAANYWLLTLLRLYGKLRAIVLTNVTYAVAICGLAWLAAGHGLTAVAAAWPAGAVCAVCVAASGLPRRAPARHRRTARHAVPGRRYAPARA
jgi:O-antigen/teichoic acid export membrane protein